VQGFVRKCEVLEMKRYDVVNSLIGKHGYKRYLEIGIALGECFAEVRCELKHSVDPTSFPVTHGMTSDDFFRDNRLSYDIVFVDGLHTAEQALRDINNSLNCLRTNGSVVVHDCLPTQESHQLRHMVGNAWTGDVWKAFAELRFTRLDLSMATVDCDWGCGIVRYGKQELYPRPPELDWAFFSKNRDSLMVVISEDCFHHG
jgi:hypothetical protein